MESEELLKKVGNKFRLLRQERGLTQEVLAGMLSLSPSAYAKLERGETDITLSRLEQVANLFGKSGLEVLEVESKNAFNFNNNDQNQAKFYQGTFQVPNAKSEELSESLDILKKQMEMFDNAIQKIVSRLDSIDKKFKKGE